MSPSAKAAYQTLRLVLLAFAIAAAFQGQWAMTFAALALRVAAWWAVLPFRRLKSGENIREFWRRKSLESQREMDLSTIVVRLACLPCWASFIPRATFFTVYWALDPVSRALLVHGKKADLKLKRLLLSDDPWLRSSAARALRELGIEDLDATLQPLLKDTVDSVRAVALDATGGPDLLSSTDPLVRLAALPEGQEASTDMVDAIRRTFESMAPGEKEDVVRLLGEKQSPAGIEFLLQLARSDDAIRFPSQKTLKSVDDPRVADLFAAEAERRPQSIAPILALAERADARAEPLIVARLAQSSAMRSGMLLALLARIPTESARQAVREHLNKGSRLTRICAAEALAMHADEPQHLRRYANSWNPLYRKLARKTLARIEKVT